MILIFAQIATCPIAGQVRIDAIVSRSGYFLGGCNCACPMNHGCPYGYEPNFDPVTLTGDCSCVPVGQPQPYPEPVPINPSPYPANPTYPNPNQPSPAFPGSSSRPGVPAPAAPTLPRQPGLPQMPKAPPIVAMDPPVEVTCTMPGPCECPAGTRAPCQITLSINHHVSVPCFSVHIRPVSDQSIFTYIDGSVVKEPTAARMLWSDVTMTDSHAK